MSEPAATGVVRPPLPLRIAAVLFAGVGILGLVMAARLAQGVWRGYFQLHHHWPMLVSITMALLGGVFAIGFWRGQFWTRPLPVVFWLLWALYAAGIQATSRHSMPAVTAFLTQLPFALLTWLYMYHGKRVAAYYAALPRPQWRISVSP